jgi:hypothetical protein
MSFWKEQPVSVGDTVSQILSAEDLLAKINTEIDAAKIKLEYKTFFGDKIENGFRDTILEFINSNYLCSKNIMLHYDTALFSYYLKDTLVIQFHPKDNPDKIVGIIIGKKKNLHIDEQVVNVIEVNFLCLNSKLRSMHLAPYMIGVLTRESVIQLNISVAYYTICETIKSPSFGKKKIFCRPININNLVKVRLWDINVKESERLYNRFGMLRPVKYSSGIANPDLAKDLEVKLLDYNKKTYRVYDNKDEAYISNILTSSAFHNFEFYDNNTLTDFISLYRLDSRNKANGLSFKNGYIFLIYLSSNDPAHIQSIIETIAAYCLKNNIIDIITMADILPVSNYQTQLKFISGDELLSYYIFNMNMVTIENTKNALVTI